MSDVFQSKLVLSGVVLLALFPLGILGLLSPIFVWPIFAIHLGLLLSANFYAVKTFARDLSPRYRLPALILVLALVMTCVSMALVPVTARDALIHHLTLPKWWLGQGGVSTFSWFDVSYYPQLIQLAFVPLLQVFPPQGCAIYHLLYLIPVAGGAHALANAIGPNSPPSSSHPSSSPACWAFIISISIPIFLRLASEPLVDLPLAAFCAVATTLLVQQNILGGVALGLALGTKYNALPFSVFLVLMAPMLRVRLSFLAKFGSVALVVAAPWLVRNFIETGNPLFPLGGGHGGVGSLETRTFLYGESWASLLSTPISMLFGGADDDPRRFDGVLSPLLLLSVIGIWRNRTNRNVTALAGVVVAYFIVAQVSSGARIRYLLPILPIVIVFTAYGLRLLSARLVGLIFCAHLVWVAVYLTNRIERIAVSKYLFSAQTRDEYLEQKLPEFKFSKEISQLIPPSQQVYLVLTGNRFFYLPFKARSAGYLSGPELVGWIAKGAVDSELKQRNCKFLLINMRLFESLRPPSSPNSFLEQLSGSLIRIATSGDLVLFKTK